MSILTRLMFSTRTACSIFLHAARRVSRANQVPDGDERDEEAGRRKRRLYHVPSFRTCVSA